jgi:Cof subfamily protein (haloacid dehalogenase superfamily)
MKQQLIFFDIDGTLLDHDKQLPLATKQAIEALKEKGHEVAIATGRAPFMFEELRKELEIDTYVSYNGQYVVANNKVLYKNPLSTETLAALTRAAATNDHPLVYMDHEDMKATVENHPYMEESMSTLKIDRYPTHNPKYLEEREIYQSLLFCKNEDEAQYADAFEQFRFVRWHPLSTDVLPAGGSKARGLQAVMDAFDFTAERVYAFGDGLNDIEMLQFVGNSVAMGNAPDDVKKAAKHVTKDVQENGILHGLEMVGLLK